MGGPLERVGDALQRAPYAWLVTTILLLWIVMVPLPAMLADAGEGSTPLSVAAAVYIVFGAVGSLVVLPRFMLPRLSQTSEGAVASLRWAFAALHRRCIAGSAAPFMVGYAATIAGGEPWVVGAGFVVSTLLLIVTARAIRAAAG
jgi:hypothetical protein